MDPSPDPVDEPPVLFQPPDGFRPRPMLPLKLNEPLRMPPMRPRHMRLTKRSVAPVLVAGFFLAWIFTPTEVIAWPDQAWWVLAAFWLDIAALIALLGAEGRRLWTDGEPGDGLIFAVIALIATPLAILAAAVLWSIATAVVATAVALYQFSQS